MDHYEEGVKALTGLAEIKKGAIEILTWLHRHGPLSYDEIVAIRAAKVKRNQPDDLATDLSTSDHLTARPVNFDLSNLMNETYLIGFGRDYHYRLTREGRIAIPAYLRMARKIPPRPCHQGWGDVEGDPEDEAAALRRFRREDRP